jgi:hypothetical protein
LKKHGPKSNSLPITKANGGSCPATHFLSGGTVALNPVRLVITFAIVSGVVLLEVVGHDGIAFVATVYTGITGKVK